VLANERKRRVTLLLESGNSLILFADEYFHHTGWIEYYGRYAPSALYPLLRYVNHTLVAWAMRKFKRFKNRTILAGRFFERLAKVRSDLFVHWQNCMVGVFA